jgi:signal transduction histidine kinase
MACNDSGVWNEAGTILDFSILPAYYQTVWFRASCAAACLLLLWAIYRFRVHQLQRQFAMALEARVSERARIARELHDTLLQSIHGLLFRFQAARNMLPRRPQEAMQALDEIISRAEQAIAEGRSAIQNLRSAPTTPRVLANVLTTTAKDLAAEVENPPSFDVIVEGERQPLAGVFEREVFVITRELLQNAFQHAKARHIEAEIRYHETELRVRIRDDGKGIDPKVREEGGRDGHWGLQGVRERAREIGARLDIWSETGAGTEIELTVPANIAYGKPKHSSRFRLFRKTSHEQS